jgi:NADPH:quinone reductase-like Zn-dependent oxidoreductase
MKAIVQNGYGSPEVLTLAEVEKPAVKDGEVLVRVRATSINAGDYFSMRGSPWLIRFSVGVPRPRNYILGWDVAGTVEAVGSGVTELRPGDEVFGAVAAAFAEYACAPEGVFGPKPTNLTFEQAAAVPTAALTALQGLRNTGEVQPGQKILVNGASGGVGSFVVQIAKVLGAEVTGVCSGKNADLVRSLGADHVIDYTQEDFTRGKGRYDLIMDQVGNHSPSRLRRVLTPGGRIQPNSGHGGMGYVFQSLLLSLFMRQHGKLFVADSNRKDMIALRDLLEAGKVTPVIDRTYALSDVPEALGYADRGHVRGKVVIAVQQRPVTT